MDLLLHEHRAEETLASTLYNCSLITQNTQEATPALDQNNIQMNTELYHWSITATISFKNQINITYVESKKVVVVHTLHIFTSI